MRVLRLGVPITLLTAAACGSNPSAPSNAASATLVFKASPLDEAAVVGIVALGNLNPPGHTLPTDHIYVNNRRPGDPPTAPIPVYAPGEGTVRFILRTGAEAKIGVGVGSYTYYLGHVELDPSIAEGAKLSAGQRIGRTGSLTYGIDLGVLNDARTNFFANPARYSPETVNGEAPLKFFDEPLRSRLYALVQRAGAERDGRFDYDVTGRLAGNWFLDGLPVASSSTDAAWPQQLAFVFDNYDPSAVRVSIGGTLGVVGAFAVQAGAPDPRDVGPELGKVTYRLAFAGQPGQAGGSQIALLIVQLLDAGRIRVEVVQSSTATEADFSARARVYVR